MSSSKLSVENSISWVLGTVGGGEGGIPLALLEDKKEGVLLGRGGCNVDNLVGPVPFICDVEVAGVHGHNGLGGEADNSGISTTPLVVLLGQISCVVLNYLEWRSMTRGERCASILLRCQTCWNVSYIWQNDSSFVEIENDLGSTYSGGLAMVGKVFCR